MRYIKYHFENGYCGCDEEDVIIFEDKDTNDDINAHLYADLQDYASDYEHVADGYDADDGWESEEAEDYYYENCNYYWEEITEQEYHEFLGDWEDDENEED